jgi:N-acetylmuramoyl-L-alanine amidase
MTLPVIDCPSPNFEPRRGCEAPDMLILHYTGTATAEVARRWLCAPESRVSSHYLVDEDGTITRMVEESERAWHAGVSCWKGETDINSRSIGIEIHNPGHDIGYEAYPEPQMRALIALCQEILARHPIPREHVLGHSDVAPFRKIDPGERFDWERLWKAGIGHWVRPAPLAPGGSLAMGMCGAEVERLQQMLAQYGYNIAPTRVFDRETEWVVKAFQRHFRPMRVDGRADRSTLDTLERLLAERPKAPGPVVLGRLP